MIIYRITNKINNKIYIGQTGGELKQRIASYLSNINRYKNKKRSDKYPIIMAMVKYGFENFQFDIIEDNIKNQIELDSKEIFYIKEFNSRNQKIGYNIQSGGKSGGCGRYKKLSPNQCKEMIEIYLSMPIDQYNTITKIQDTIKSKFNCSHSTILRILKEYNIELRRRVPTKKQRDNLIKRNRDRKINR